MEVKNELTKPFRIPKKAPGSVKTSVSPATPASSSRVDPKTIIDCPTPVDDRRTPVKHQNSHSRQFAGRKRKDDRERKCGTMPSATPPAKRPAPLPQLPPTPTNYSTRRTEDVKREDSEDVLDTRNALPVDRIFADMNKEVVRSKRDSESASLPEHKGMGACLSREALERHSQEDILVYDILKRDSLMERLLGHKMMYGRLDVFSNMGYHRIDTAQERLINGPQCENDVALVPSRVHPLANKRPRTPEGSPVRPTLPLEVKEPRRGPRTPPGSPGPLCSPPVRQTNPADDRTSVLMHFSAMTGTPVAQLDQFFGDDLNKVMNTMDKNSILATIKEALRCAGDQVAGEQLNGGDERWRSQTSNTAVYNRADSVRMELVSDCSLTPPPPPPPPPPLPAQNNVPPAWPPPCVPNDMSQLPPPPLNCDQQQQLEIVPTRIIAPPAPPPVANLAPNSFVPVMPMNGGPPPLHSVPPPPSGIHGMPPMSVPPPPPLAGATMMAQRPPSPTTSRPPPAVTTHPPPPITIHPPPNFGQFSCKVPAQPPNGIGFSVPPPSVQQPPPPVDSPQKQMLPHGGMNVPPPDISAPPPSFSAPPPKPMQPVHTGQLTTDPVRAFNVPPPFNGQWRDSGGPNQQQFSGPPPGMQQENLSQESTSSHFMSPPASFNVPTNQSSSCETLQDIKTNSNTQTLTDQVVTNTLLSALGIKSSTHVNKNTGKDPVLLDRYGCPLPVPGQQRPQPGANSQGNFNSSMDQGNGSWNSGAGIWGNQSGQQPNQNGPMCQEPSFMNCMPVTSSAAGSRFLNSDPSQMNPGTANSGSSSFQQGSGFTNQEMGQRMGSGNANGSGPPNRPPPPSHMLGFPSSGADSRW